MTINAAQFREYVIAPALAALATAGIPVSKTAADLLMATAAVETQLGTYLRQVNGPARSVFQIEPATLTQTLGAATQEQLAAIQGLAATSIPDGIFGEIDTNLVLSAVCARLIYWQSPMPLPPDTIAGLWSMYKPVWNTRAGATTLAEFIAAIKLTDISLHEDKSIVM